MAERKNRLAAVAYGGAQLSLIGKEKRRRRRSVDVPGTRAESTKDPPVTGATDSKSERTTLRPRPPATRSTVGDGDKGSRRQEAYRAIVTRARAVERVRESLRERGRTHASPTRRRDTPPVETRSPSPPPLAPIVTVEELPAASEVPPARRSPIYVDSSDEDDAPRYSDDEDFEAEEVEVEEIEDEENEVEEEEEPPPVSTYRVPARESPPRPAVVLTPATPEPVDWNQNNEEAPRNAHRRLVASEASSATPKPTAMASRQRETPPAPSRSVSLPSLKTRQPQPRSLGRQGGSNESSPPSKQLVNEKLPALPGTSTPTAAAKNRLAAVAYGAMASRSLVPTPTPVKPPAPPTTPREPGSQQGVRAARVQQSTVIANAVYEDFKKGFVPLRELVARKKAAEKKVLPPRKPASIGQSLWMVALSAVKWKNWVRRGRADGVRSPHRIKSPVRVLSPVRSRIPKDEWARSLDLEKKRVNLTARTPGTRRPRKSAVVRPGAFESEPAPVRLGAAAADHRAAAAYSKTKIKVLTKSEVKRAPKKADDETESPPISKSAEVATPPQWIQNPLAQSAAAARRRRFLAEMAVADADPELSRPVSRAPTRPSSPKLGRQKESALDRLRGAVTRLMEHNRNIKKKSLPSPKKQMPVNVRDVQQRAEWAQRMHMEEQAAAGVEERSRRRVDVFSTSYVRPGAFGSEASPVQLGVDAANQRAASAYSMLTKKPTPRKLSLSPIAEAKKPTDSPPPPKPLIASPLTQKLVERARQREAQLRRQRRKTKPKRKGFKSTSDPSVRGEETPPFSVGDMRDIDAQYRSQARKIPGQGRAGVKRGGKSEWAVSLERDMRVADEARAREEARRREASPEHVPRKPGVFDVTLTPVELGTKAAGKRAAAAYMKKTRRKKPEKDDDAYSLNFDSDELSEDFDSDWDDDEVYLSAELDAHFEDVSPIVVRPPSISPEPQTAFNAFARDIATDVLRDACEAVARDVAVEALREALSKTVADVLGEISDAAVDVAELDSAFAHGIIYSALDLCDIEEAAIQAVYDCADDAADAVEIDAVVYGQMERAVQACELDGFILDIVYDLVETVPATSKRWEEDRAFEAAAAERMAFVKKLKDRAASRKEKESRPSSRGSRGEMDELQQRLDALREQHKQVHEDIHEQRRWGKYLEHTPKHMLRDREFSMEQSDRIWDQEPAVALRYRKNPLYDPVLATNDDILEWEPNDNDAFELPESVVDSDESTEEAEAEATPEATPRRERVRARDKLAARAYANKQQLVSSPKDTPTRRTRLKDDLPTTSAIKRAERAERIAEKTKLAQERALLSWTWAQGKRPPSPQPWEDDDAEADMHAMLEEEARIREAELAVPGTEEPKTPSKTKIYGGGRGSVPPKKMSVAAMRQAQADERRARGLEPLGDPKHRTPPPGQKRKKVSPQRLQRPPPPQPWEDDDAEADLHAMFEEEARIREAELALQAAEQNAAASRIQAMHRGRMARKHVEAKRAKAAAAATPADNSPGSSPGQENHSPGSKKKRKPKTTPRTKAMSPLESVYSTSGMRRKGRRSLA